MSATMAKTKADLHQAKNRAVHGIKEGIKLAEDGAEKLVAEVKDVVEDAVDAILPKVERVISTMNRQYSILHAFREEVKCCWQHSHWGWAKTVLGPNLLQPVDEDGEWAFIRSCFRSWRFGPLIQLFLLSFGSLLFPPMGFFLLLFLWERSYVTEIGSRDAVVRTARAKERWVFVNGMCVDNNLGNGNATQLSKLFNRQVGFFHNPTQGLLFDFFECMVGRTFNFQTPVSRQLTACLTSALENEAFEKVVLVVHSQGAIIASNAIELLIKKQVPLRKLEVFTFGSAADEFMQVYDESTKKSYPYYEHYANEYDYVAQIGIFHWHVPGSVYTASRDGHFFGDHYLPSFQKREFKLYCGARNAKSKLYSYLDIANREKQADAGKPLKKQKLIQPSIPTFLHTSSSSSSSPPYPLSPHLHTPPSLSPLHFRRLSPIPLSPIPLSPSDYATPAKSAPSISKPSSPPLSPAYLSPSPSPPTTHKKKKKKKKIGRAHV
eukprot:Phypoly_transcript_08002.p1 GENE.Phypoly_transcript_08002~~Phypoly_transcript_08002.p1  ORF type:complete len:492 (+),score=107.49 Phypoly_transcript_08002:50-1525(+)